MVKLIVAKASNNVIGKDNDLIWNLPADMHFFTSTTKGHVVIMGRRNWDSIPLKYRPLPGRENVVVTRNKDFNDDGCKVFHSIEESINYYADDERDVYIIGGAQVYKYVIDNGLIDEMLITFVEQAFDGDAFFPDFDESDWDKGIIMEHPIDEKNPHAFKVYRYTRKN